MAPSDEDVVPAFEQLVERYRRPLVSMAYRMLGNFEDARDAAQDAFIRYWRAHLEPPDQHAAFLVLGRIVINLCIDRLRTRRRSASFAGAGNPHSHPPASDDPERHVRNGELKTVLDSAAARLKPKQKAVFMLRDVEGYSVRETADIMGCSENNVLVNLHLARKNLRKWLTPYLEE